MFSRTDYAEQNINQTNTVQCKTLLPVNPLGMNKYHTKWGNYVCFTEGNDQGCRQAQQDECFFFHHHVNE